MDITFKKANADYRYLKLLSQSFPTIADASTEIINLSAILNLPKGTEHFLADIYGEIEAFQHVLKNASGNIKRKVDELFGNSLRETEKKELCTLIYYPEQKLEIIKAAEQDISDWYHTALHRLVAVCRDVSSKYTRSKVRKSLPEDFSYIIQELLHERPDDIDKAAYVNGIISTIISTGRADDFIIHVQAFRTFVVNELFQFRRVDALMDTFENEFCDDRILRQFFLGLGDEIAVKVDKFKFIDGLYQKVKLVLGHDLTEGAVTVVYGALEILPGTLDFGKLIGCDVADISLIGVVGQHALVGPKMRL